MRFDPVFGATAYVSNRFLLTGLAAKAVRKLHRPNTGIQNTANDVFVRFSRATHCGSFGVSAEPCIYSIAPRKVRPARGGTGR